LYSEGGTQKAKGFQRDFDTKAQGECLIYEEKGKRNRVIGREAAPAESARYLRETNLPYRVTT